MKSKKIGRLRKGARENSKIHKSFLFRISLNKKRQQESEYKQTNNQTSSLFRNSLDNETYHIIVCKRTKIEI